MFQNYLKTILICVISCVVSSCTVISNILPTQTPFPTYTPYPTQTPYPTFTPAPSPTSTPEKKVIYEESDFSGFDSCFQVYSDSDIRLFPESGQYHMMVQTPNYYSWSTCEIELRNFILEVDATIVEGPDNNAYGVFFRQDSESGGFYTLLISGDGYYSLVGIFPSNDPPNDLFPLLSWSSIREIRQGKKLNHLKVVAFGDQIELYVNDVLVGLIREGTFTSGSFGFFVQAFDEKGVHITFDNLIISEP